MIRSVPPRHTNGFVLIVVLWTMAILALLIAGLAGVAGREARLTRTLRESAVARAAADAVLAQSITDVLRSGHTVPGIRRFGDLRVAVALEDYSGRVNPNIANIPLLQVLLLELGVEPRRAAHLAAAIVDWRSPSAIASPNGAKAPAYRAAGLRYGPPGRPFENLDEVGFVLGMDPATLAALKPHMTLWASSDPDPTFADPFVLAALRSTGVPPATGVSNEARIIAITAAAYRGGAESARRRAVVRFGYSPDGRGWRILALDDGDGP